MKSPEYLTKVESREEDLLQRINRALKELGSSSKWLKLPKFLPDYESLRGKKILLVDDVVEVVESLIPDLMVATDGNASFIHYKEQELELIISEILEKNPDIILLDYNLSESLKGTEIARILKEKAFTGKSIGFSSEKDTSKKFIDAGAFGYVEKNAYDPEACLKGIAKIVN